MAGTNRAKSIASGASAAAHPPAVVLVEPQLGENIGMVARAMLNCGLTELRLVRPRDGWPNPAAVAASSGADLVIEGARVFETTVAAIADLHRVYAASARERGMVKPVVTPRQAATEMRELAARGGRVGLLFGPERSGLFNDDVALGDALLQVPLNPAYSSLNLAQAVLLVAYEWYQWGDATPAGEVPLHGGLPAEKAQLIGFFERLEDTLDEVGFFFPPEKRPGMVRNLRSLFERAVPTEQEVRTLQGILSALQGAKLRRAPKNRAPKSPKSR